MFSHQSADYSIVVAHLMSNSFDSDNIFVSFGGTLFRQVVGIPMGTSCAPLLADLFLYSFLQKLVKDKKIHEPLISHTGILKTIYLSIILDLQNFFH